jgi:hypothetical protein
MPKFLLCNEFVVPIGVYDELQIAMQFAVESVRDTNPTQGKIVDRHIRVLISGDKPFQNEWHKVQDLEVAEARIMVWVPAV